MLWSIPYPADQHYYSVAAENNVQVFVIPNRLVSVYVLNVSAAEIYVVVSDTAAGPAAPVAGNITMYAIYPCGTAGADGYVAISTHGGDQLKNGLYVAAYTTAAKALAGGAPDAGNVLVIKADWTRGYLPNPAAV